MYTTTAVATALRMDDTAPSLQATTCSVARNSSSSEGLAFLLVSAAAWGTSEACRLVTTSFSNRCLTCATSPRSAG